MHAPQRAAVRQAASSPNTQQLCPHCHATVVVQLQRLIYVDNPDLGYVKGNQEIPAGADFELEVEVLSVVGPTVAAAGSSGASSG